MGCPSRLGSFLHLLFLFCLCSYCFVIRTLHSCLNQLFENHDEKCASLACCSNADRDFYPKLTDVRDEARLRCVHHRRDVRLRTRQDLKPNCVLSAKGPQQPKSCLPGPSFQMESFPIAFEAAPICVEGNCARGLVTIRKDSGVF